jgi:hypothetical protein
MKDKSFRLIVKQTKLEAVKKRFENKFYTKSNSSCSAQ